MNNSKSIDLGVQGKGEGGAERRPGWIRSPDRDARSAFAKYRARSTSALVDPAAGEGRAGGEL